MPLALHPPLHSLTLHLILFFWSRVQGEVAIFFKAVANLQSHFAQVTEEGSAAAEAGGGGNAGGPKFSVEQEVAVLTSELAAKKTLLSEHRELLTIWRDKLATIEARAASDEFGIGISSSGARARPSASGAAGTGGGGAKA